MKYFPLFTDIKEKSVIICGGGRHAIEKINRILPFGPEIRVIAKEISQEIEKIDGIRCERRGLSKEDLTPPPVFVIAAGDRQHDERIAELCRKHNVPVNAVDRQDLCDFIFPSVIATENLCIGVSTGGVSPAAAVKLKNDISEIIPDSIDSILSWLQLTAREYVREKVESKSVQVKILHKIVDAAFKADRALEIADIDSIIEEIVKSGQ